MEPIVLRSDALRIFCWIGAIGCLVMFGATAASGPGPNPGPVDYVGTAVFGVVMAGGFARAARCGLRLTDNGIDVLHIFTTDFVQWSDVADVSVSYGGLQIRRKDGSVVTAGSLGKDNWSTWRHKRTKADDRLEALRAAVEAHRPE